MRLHPLWAAIAVTVLIALIPVLAKDAGHRGREDGKAEYQQHRATAPLPLANSPSPPTASERASCPGTSQGKFDCDTVSAIANVRQANAAERFNILAIFEIFVGLVTAVVAGVAAWFAWSASVAAHNGNRPWIVYHGMEGGEAGAFKSDEQSHPLVYPFRLLLKNSRPLPAIEFQAGWKHFILPKDVIPFFDPFVETPPATLGSDCPIGSKRYYLTPEQLESIRQPNHERLFIYGYVTYRDPSKPKKLHATEMCFSIYCLGFNNRIAMFDGQPVGQQNRVI